jgi:hypothetical protein
VGNRVSPLRVSATTAGLGWTQMKRLILGLVIVAGVIYASNMLTTPQDWGAQEGESDPGSRNFSENRPIDSWGAYLPHASPSTKTSRQERAEQPEVGPPPSMVAKTDVAPQASSEKRQREVAIASRGSMVTPPVPTERSRPAETHNANTPPLPSQRPKRFGEPPKTPAPVTSLSIRNPVKPHREVPS